MTDNEKANFRAALRDELATIRAIKTALTDPMDVDTRTHLEQVVAECYSAVRQLLQSLHPLALPRARARAVARITGTTEKTQ